MKKSFIKSFLGLALAATLMVGEAGTAFAASAGTETTPSEVTVEDVEATGTAGKPAQVTGVKVMGTYLTWNSQEMTAYGYDVKATNAAGETFYSWEGSTANGWQYGAESATSHSYPIQEQVLNLCGSTLHSNDWSTEYLKPGTKYSYQVRAINRVSAKNASGNTTYTYTYGPWSSVVTYTLPGYTQYTKVTFDTKNSDEDTIYLNLGQKSNGTYPVYANIYTNAACTIKARNWPVSMARISAGQQVYGWVSGLQVGKTYYVRVYEDETKLSNVVPIVLKKKQASYTSVPATGAIKITKTDSNGVWIDTPLSATINAYYGYNYITYEYSKDGKSWQNLDTQYSSSDVQVRYTKLASITGTPNTPVYFRARGYVSVNGSYVYTAYSPVYTINSPAISTIKGLNYEQTSSGYRLKYTGTIKSNVERICYEYSKSKKFVANYAQSDKNKNVVTGYGDTIDYTSLEPGATYYVRAYVKSSYYDNKDAITSYQNSGYTNVITIKPAVSQAVVSAGITASSVQLVLGTKESGLITGYEVARKNGKSYKVLAKTTDSVYKDSKLTSDAKYTYRVRAYYFNTKNGKTYYGAPAYVSAVTWGSDLTLKAIPASTTSVKLSWKKVSGAQGYEIYRTVGSGIEQSYYTYSESNGCFDKMQLVKNITNAGTTSYTDKGLDAGTSYDYVVRAYRQKDGKQYYISDGAYVTLGLAAPTIMKKTQSTKNGKLKVTWKRVIAAKGYLIEKQDKVTGTWKKVKDIKKNSTVSYTFPAVKGTDTSVTYRIRAYSGKKYSEGTEVIVNRCIATVSGVKAKASSNGSITVSWKKVSGADYYRVYRTTSSRNYKNAITGKIAPLGICLYSYEKPYEDGKQYVTTTKFVDQKVSYTNDFGEEVVVKEGPASGVKYYYYVVAYKIVDEDYNAAEVKANNIDLTRYTAISSYGCAKPASAKAVAVKPAAPKIKSVKSSKKKQVTVTLSKKVDGAVRYEVYRSTNSKKGFKLVGTTKKTTYTDKKVSSKKTYYYKVRAVKYSDAGTEVYSKYSKVSKKVKAK